ncbi:MAG TPA: DNA polymerase III subunit beta [Baekduia sp.]|nr:DNA polymerase III subunit beta [Baekduia sp.]
MNLSTSVSELLAQLQPISQVASTRAVNQVLSGVQIAASQSGTELRATDTDLSLRVPLVADVVREGTVVLPARLLLDVVRSLPKSADRVTLELRPEQQDVEVTAGAAVFHLRTLRADDFPTLPEPGGDTVAELPAGPFLDTIAMVSKSASRDETRPVLTGILVSVNGDELRMVSTDSYRLSIKDTKLGASVAEGFEANIPARALDELKALSSGEESELVRVGVRANQVVFSIGEAVLSSRLIDGQFPNFQQLLPDSFEHQLRISGDELREVVRRISLLAQKNAPLRLSFTEGQLTVSAQTPDIGEASEPLPVPFSGEPMDIGFNPDFLRDGLDAIGDGDLILNLLSPLRPGLISTADGSGFQYLIMPIRLSV